MGEYIYVEENGRSFQRIIRLGGVDDLVGSLPVERLSGYGNFMCDLEFMATEGKVCGTSSVG